MKKIKVVLISILFTIPTQTYAAEDACVSLLVGAGYAAHMRIKSGAFKTDWSKSFAIGQTRCQSLEGVPYGKKFTVEVHAILGKKKNCSPSIEHSKGSGSITFQAWGTTLNVKCKMPTSNSGHVSGFGHTPNANGVKAKSKLKK